MPPRSVCLNVFTTSLGNGSMNKEAEVVVGEVTRRSSGGAAEERARHDSVQEGKFHHCFFLTFPTLNGTLVRMSTWSVISQQHQTLSLRTSHSRKLSPMQTHLPSLPLPSTSPPFPLTLKAQVRLRNYFCDVRVFLLFTMWYLQFTQDRMWILR